MIIGNLKYSSRDLYYNSGIEYDYSIYRSEINSFGIEDGYSILLVPSVLLPFMEDSFEQCTNDFQDRFRETDALIYVDFSTDGDARLSWSFSDPIDQDNIRKCGGTEPSTGDIEGQLRFYIENGFDYISLCSTDVPSHYFIILCPIVSLYDVADLLNFSTSRAKGVLFFKECVTFISGGGILI